MSDKGRCDGKLAGGEGKLAAMEAREAADLDIVFRRPPAVEMGMAAADCSGSWMAAVRAATLGVWLVTDFRRVTRWFGLRAPVRRE